MKQFIPLIVSLQICATSLAGGVYFQQLGAPPDGDSAYLSAMTPDGSLLVGHASLIGPNGRYRAFEWTQDSGFTWLNDPAGNWYYIFVRDVSDDGRVVVGNTASFSPSAAAIVWVDGVPTNIGYLPGGSEEAGAEAWGVSADGSVVVGWCSSSAGRQAFSWTNGVFTPLGFLEGGTESRAYDISSDGSIIVGTSTSSLGREAVKWEAGVIQSIGDLPGGLVYGDARSITPDGSVIAGRGRTTAGLREFRWKDGVMIDLGDIPEGFDYQEPGGISADGNVIGGVGYAPVGDEIFDTAIVWDSVMGMRNLNSVLVEDFNIDLGDFVLHETSDVSADGRTLIGYGSIPHNSLKAWIARIDYRCRISDLNVDLRTDLTDLTLLLSHFGACSSSPNYLRSADLDQSGCIDLPDLTLLLAEFGTVCP